MENFILATFSGTDRLSCKSLKTIVHNETLIIGEKKFDIEAYENNLKKNKLAISRDGKTSGALGVEIEALDADFHAIKLVFDKSCGISLSGNKEGRFTFRFRDLKKVGGSCDFLMSVVTIIGVDV